MNLSRWKMTVRIMEVEGEAAAEVNGRRMLDSCVWSKGFGFGLRGSMKQVEGE